MYSLVIYEIIGVSVNTLTIDDKYSLRNTETLPQSNQINFPKKQKNISQFSAQFLKQSSNCEQFEKNMTLTAYVFPKLQTVKDVARQMSKKSCFRTPFDSQHIFHHSKEH